MAMRIAWLSDIQSHIWFVSSCVGKRFSEYFLRFIRWLTSVPEAVAA